MCLTSLFKLMPCPSKGFSLARSCIQVGIDMIGTVTAQRSSASRKPNIVAETLRARVGSMERHSPGRLQGRDRPPTGQWLKCHRDRDGLALEMKVRAPTDVTTATRVPPRPRRPRDPGRPGGPGPGPVLIRRSWSLSPTLAIINNYDHGRSAIHGAGHHDYS